MAIKLTCPRCKKPLSVPQKKAGSYANCPQCNGRFWVAKDARGDGPSAEAPAASSGALPPVAAPGGAVAGAPATPAPASPWRDTPAPPTSATSSPPLPALASGRKVARFVAAEAAQSTLKIADDGKLPELHLQDNRQKSKAEAKATSMNPLLLVGLLSLSVVVSIVLVLYDTEPDSAAHGQQAQQARKIIEEEFFGEIGRKDPPEPYQILLREAQQAYSRGDRKTERELYRQVLELLRAERTAHEKGLSGSRSRDKRLEAQIAILLSSR